MLKCAECSTLTIESDFTDHEETVAKMKQKELILQHFHNVLSTRVRSRVIVSDGWQTIPLLVALKLQAFLHVHPDNEQKSQLNPGKLYYAVRDHPLLNSLVNEKTLRYLEAKCLRPSCFRPERPRARVLISTGV